VWEIDLGFALNSTPGWGGAPCGLQVTFADDPERRAVKKQEVSRVLHVSRCRPFSGLRGTEPLSG